MVRPVYSSGGMIATAHPLATAAGLRVLQAGGSAVDAGIAAGLVLNVVLPMMCSPGGDVFMLGFDAVSKGVWSINSSGPAGLCATRAEYLKRGYKAMPLRGALAVSVPGQMRGFQAAWEQHGRLPWTGLFEDAIKFARRGHPVAEHEAQFLAQAEKTLQADPELAGIYLKDGRVASAGQLLVQADLGDSLERLASLGADDLYDGQLGKILLENLANRGGLFAGPEWRGFAPELAKPISMDYRGMRVYETAPPSQGIIVLEAMGILKGLDPAICSRTLSTDAVHFMVEALKIAFTDRNSGVADPVFHENRLDTVLSEQYLAAAFNRISPQKSTEIVNSPLIDGDTTYLCAVDADGNAISMIESVSHSFGAGFAVPGTGIVLNNRAGRGFSLEAGHPNVIEPGKRSMHTLNCYLATRGDDLWLVGGTPGGDLQPQCNVQMLTALIDGGLNPEEAVRLPRWTLFPGTDPEYVGQPWEIQVEADFPEDVFFELQARGHRLQRKPYWESPGAVQLIMVDPDTRIRQGASDHRTDGFVLGY